MKNLAQLPEILKKKKSANISKVEKLTASQMQGFRFKGGILHPHIASIRSVIYSIGIFKI